MKLPRPWIFRVGLLVVAATVVCAVVGLAVSPLLFALEASLIGLAFAFARMPSASVSGKVSVDADWLTLGGRRLVALATLRSSELRRDDAGAWLFVERGSFRSLPTLAIGVEDDDDARALLAVLRMDARHRSANYELLTRRSGPIERHLIFALLLLSVVAACATFVDRAHGNLPLLGAIVSGAGLVGVGLYAELGRRVRLRVGGDAIVIERSLARSQSISLVDVVGLEANGLEIAIQTKDGAKLRFVDRPNVGRGVSAAGARIREVLALRDEGAPPELASSLERSAGSAREWLRALRQLSVSAPYRASSMPRESLLGVATSPRIGVRHRVAAIVALGAELGPEERARIEAVAARELDASAVRRVRVALEGDDPALEELLDEVEERTVRR